MWLIIASSWRYSWGPSLWAQVPAGGDPCYHKVCAGLRGLCTSLEELWRWSLCLLHAAWPGFCNGPCWASAVAGKRSASLLWDILELYLHIRLQSPHLLWWQAVVTILTSLKEAESGFSVTQVLWIKVICSALKKHACMEQAQKPRRWHGLQELLSGRSQTLSLMFNLLLCLRATKHSVFEMLSLLCHPCVSQALLFSPREIYYYYCFFMHLLCPGLNWLLEGYIVAPGRAFGWSIQQRFWTAADRRQLRAACGSPPRLFYVKGGNNTSQKHSADLSAWFLINLNYKPWACIITSCCSFWVWYLHQ